MIADDAVMLTSPVLLDTILNVTLLPIFVIVGAISVILKLVDWGEI